MKYKIQVRGLDYLICYRKHFFSKWIEFARIKPIFDTYRLEGVTKKMIHEHAETAKQALSIIKKINNSLESK